MGLYLNIIKQMCPNSKYIDISKPINNFIDNITNISKNELNKNTLIIGDSLKSDIKLACVANCCAVWINEDKKNGYDFDNNCFVIHNINQLLEYLDY